MDEMFLLYSSSVSWHEKTQPFCDFKMCGQHQIIFMPESNVELELVEEEKEEEGDEEEDNVGEESHRRVMQLLCCGRYKEAVLLACHLWEKRKEDEKPEERENDIRESAMKLVGRMSKEGAAIAL